jgi:hypothetical protein
MFQGVINGVSAIAIPLLILAIVGHGWYKKVKVYEVFTEGAKEGFTVAVRIIPFLVAIRGLPGFRCPGSAYWSAKPPDLLDWDARRSHSHGAYASLKWEWSHRYCL